MKFGLSVALKRLAVGSNDLTSATKVKQGWASGPERVETDVPYMPHIVCRLQVVSL